MLLLESYNSYKMDKKVLTSYGCLLMDLYSNAIIQIWTP